MKLGENRQNWPKTGTIGRKLAKLVENPQNFPKIADFGQKSAKLVEFWSNLVENSNPNIDP
jgi:hypothetical protein